MERRSDAEERRKGGGRTRYAAIFIVQRAFLRAAGWETNVSKRRRRLFLSMHTRGLRRITRSGALARLRGWILSRKDG